MIFFFADELIMQFMEDSDRILSELHHVGNSSDLGRTSIVSMEFRWSFDGVSMEFRSDFDRELAWFTPAPQ